MNVTLNTVCGIEIMVRTLFLLVIAAMAVDSSAQELEFKSAELPDGQKIEYGLLLPEGFEKDKEYPILLALPPGQQNKDMVKAGIGLYWERGASEGWLVVSPAAPKGKFFSGDGAELLKQFMDVVGKDFKAEGGKYYVAGVSNGGRSAFSIAGRYPESFHALIGIPGMVTGPDKKYLKKLKDLPMSLYAGANDKSWVQPMEKMVGDLKKLGAAEVTLEIVAGQGHVIRGWEDGKKLFTVLNLWRNKILQAD